MGGTGVSFRMPSQSPSLLMSMAYCSWYFIANVEVPEYKIKFSGLKLIVAKYKGKAHQYEQGKRVRVAGFYEYEALSAGSEVEPEGRGEGRSKATTDVADEAIAEAHIEEGQAAEEGVAAGEGEEVSDKHFKRYKRRSSAPSSPP